jgi:O-antigen/teichoic acid export membrane protein
VQKAQVAEPRNLTKAASSALKWNYIGLGARVFSSFTIGVVLARLLGPKPFGQVAIAVLVISFGNLLADFGFGAALIQSKEISEEDIRFTFSLQILIGLALSSIGIAFGGMIAQAFHQPEVSAVIRGLSLVFDLQSFGQSASAILMRNLRFRWTQSCQVISYVVAYLAVGIPLAYFGFGVWALVTAQLLQTIVNASLLYFGCRHSVKPLFNCRTHILRFGGKVTISNLTNWAISNLDNAFVGRFFGAAPLGLYSRAFSLVSMPMTGTVSAMQTALFSASSRSQDNLPAIRRAYLAAVNLLSIILFPICTAIAIAPHTVMTGFYGPAWGPGAPFLVPLALAMPLNAFLGIAGPPLMGLGKLNELLVAQFVAATAAAITFAIASRYDAVVLSWCVLFVYVLWFVMVLRAASRRLQFSGVEFWNSLALPLGLALLVGVIVRAIDQFCPVNTPIRVVLIFASAIGIFGTAGFLFPTRLLRSETIGLLRQSFPKIASKVLS